MKAHCPACGRTTRVGREVLDFLVRCDRCRTILLARTPAEGLVAAGVEGAMAKAELLPLGRIPERFTALQRGQLAELLTRKGSRRSHNPTLAEHAARIAQRARGLKVTEGSRGARRGYGSLGALVFVAVVVAIGLLLAGMKYWVFRPAAAEASTALSTPDPLKSPISTPTQRRAVPATPARQILTVPPTDAPQPTGTGELFPDVPAR